MFSHVPRPTPYDVLRKNWLIVAILFCVCGASLYPNLGSKQGPLKTEYTVKYGTVSLIFLISGLSLKTDNVYRTFGQYNLHLFIQLFTFVFVPAVTQVIVGILSIFDINPWILKGLITVACMPPPVSSAVILTRAAQGNETAAIFNSVLGSFLGILITPISLLFNLGSTTTVPLIGTVIQLTITVLLPLFIGQLLKKYTKFKGHTLPLNTISQWALLFVIYTTFCDTFVTPETGLSASDILISVFLVVTIQILFLMVSYEVAKRMKNRFTPSDVVAIVFCSTHKSLTLGIPILRVMFHGFSHLSQISLPLLIYHPTQIILGGLLVSQLKDWAHSKRNKRSLV